MKKIELYNKAGEWFERVKPAYLHNESIYRAAALRSGYTFASIDGFLVDAVEYYTSANTQQPTQEFTE